MNLLFKIILLAGIVALPLANLGAESEKPSGEKIHKVVFEVASDGAEKWEGALRNVENLQKSFGAKATKIEVVTHGKGIGMLLAKTAEANPELKLTLEKLHPSGVVFAACENTMKKMSVTKDQLIPLATTVDSGVSEIIRKQEAGYAYLKSGG